MASRSLNTATDSEQQHRDAIAEPIETSRPARFALPYAHLGQCDSQISEITFRCHPTFGAFDWGQLISLERDELVRIAGGAA
jgi:hypothetical protein